MVEVRQARYFVAIAEELHFGRAASRLQMSQPPLSQAIRQLERELGVELLLRSSRHVALTQVGRVFLEHCHTLVRESERAQLAVRAARDGVAGSLTVGAVSSAFTDLLPDTLRRFQSNRPAVELRVLEMATDSGVRAVENHMIDAAVVRRAVVGPGCRAIILRPEELVAALPAEHPSAALEGPLHLADLANERWVWVPRHVSPKYHDEVVAACILSGFSPEATHTAFSTPAQLAMVACGLGVTLVPSNAVDPPPHVTVRRALSRSASVAGLSLVVRDDREPLVEYFLECARATLADEAARTAH